MFKPTVLTQLTGGLYLGALLFGLAVWIMLPFLLAEVRDLRVNGRLVEVKIVASYVHYRGRECTLRISFIAPDGQDVTISDAYPGDIATCRRNGEIAGRYAVGKKYTFIASGDNYFVGHGEYWWSLLIALLGFLPYTYLMYSILGAKRERKAQR